MKQDDLTATDFYGACVCLGLNRAARATSRRYDAMFKPIGITSGQFTILSALRRNEPVPISDMADLLGMDRTTLTRNLKPIETLKLVAIQPDARDRRIRSLTLTAKGRVLLKQAVPLWRKAQKESNRRIGPNRWDELRPALDVLSA
ncbi:MarR family winged helix-turn-helix transcriptional regulator [Bradyrhizobium sp. Arg237L]|uniref:MarR family winged helix-turn-helix transcriptional regulator n=1 Tax=Bradyrhizobium sp. Arg237L TaxID=3003352 RepID=UPI00249DE117|nr:MarR family winged helix-turn-helix transcriptional regulator [Bradyrhizobium sp. Arg237L]MDI4238115.1 MarR family winged helix-turn-helix transcriptional regulator [Bradyrhizobium sp. Arg237L]